jgi:hypothetical protein
MYPAGPGDRTGRNWTVRVDAEPRLERVAEALCTLADGRFGTRGSREEDGAGSAPLTLAAGVYHDPGEGTTLLPGPVWTGLDSAPPDGHDRRELDLHDGLLRRTWRTADGTTLRTLRFASLARPGVVGLRAEGRHGDITWASTRSAGPRRPRRPRSGCGRRSGSTGCWPSTAPPGRPGGPTSRSPSRATPTRNWPSGSLCSTCSPRQLQRARRRSAPAG